MSGDRKTCHVAHFKYFANCERCRLSEPIADIARPWPCCEVCGDQLAVFAIGKPLPMPPEEITDAAGADFIDRCSKKFSGEAA